MAVSKAQFSHKNPQNEEENPDNSVVQLFYFGE